MLDNIILTSIKSVHVIPTKKGRYLEICGREYYGLSLCSGEGRIVYDLNGKKTVSDKYHAVILPKGAVYNLRNEEGGDFPIINFDVLGSFTDEFISIPLTAPESYIDDFTRIEKLFSLGDSNAKLFSAFYALIAKLLRERETKPSVLTPAIEYIHKHLSDTELSNERLAQISRISEVYFRKTFKKKYGISPKQYILNLRITKAKELLSEGICSVGDVAELCGFASPYHFSRCFKDITGKTPSDYRWK